MTEAIPLAGPLKERAKEGVERLLLAPVFLMYELVAVLFPGILFIILLFLKGNHSVVSAFQSSLVGYKTKLVVVTILGYLIGKVFAIPADGLRNLLSERFFKDVQRPGSKRLKDLTKKFVGGVFLLPGFYASEHALNYLMLSLMTVAFNVSVGAVLLVSSLIPGDSFRWLETAVGALLMIRGYNGFEAYFGMIVSMLGVSLSGPFQKLLAEDFLSGYLKAMKIASAQSAGPSETPLTTVPTPAELSKT